MSLKTLYHHLVPASIRYPVGHFRRSVADHGRRLTTPGLLPPRRLLDRVQMTPWIHEYLRVGRVSASTLTEALESVGIDRDSPADVLDFGCGLGRTLRFVVDGTWRLSGCDVDAEQVTWCRRAFPGLDLRVNAPSPPLPWSADSFDALWAVSVFTHFAESEQDAWADELARVLRPGGVAAITTMGPRALGGFAQLDTPERREQLNDEGFVFHRGGEAFNARGAFHTRDGLETFFGHHFEIREWIEGGLDGFQDLTLLVRRENTAPADIDTASPAT